MQVAARELPPASALALDQKLTARARELKKAGIPGTLSRLRVLAYLERWGITDPFGHPDQDGADQDGAGQDGAGQDGADADRDQDQADADWPEDWPRTDGPDDSGPDDGSDGKGPDDDGHGPGGNGPGGNGGGCACGGTTPTGTGGDDDSMAGWLHLTVPATTLLDHGDRAGQLSKLGPVDAGLARTLADKIAQNGQSTICVTVTSPDGRPIGHACGTPARGDPARPASRRKQDPPGTSPPHDPVNPALTPLAPLTPGQPGGYGTWRLTYAGRDLDLTFETLDGPCDHRHESPGHDPGKQLKHLTAVLNQDCTLRTCRTPEHQADYEHAIPWPQGRSCWCNGHPCCRHHHRNKQAPGWHIEGTGQPGYFTWTLPSGRTYPSTPTSYPT
jgi:hypothetical protein